ncbi:MAG TPA: hypothetical protein VLK36_14200 [Gaiellaceae bacterium]|nr:hypothetical protein [Gaiellaceae bacterium]
MDPVHVLWIGGATGAGKTSISRALAYRYDLQLYNVDHRTFDHVSRVRVPPDLNWDLPPPVLADRFVEYSRNRFELVLEDLAALPASPGAIADGPFLLPSLVPAGGAAVFLVPGEERIRATGAERGQREVVVERNLVLAERIASAAETAGLPVLPVDRGLEEMTERVEALLAPAVAGLPRGGDLAAVRRFENDVLAEQVRLYRASGEAPPGSPPLLFACECGRSGCAEEIELTLEDYLRVSAGADRSPLRRPRS